MRQEVKDAWVQALESGEYEQGTGALRTVGDKYCCLGVLCDLAVKAGVAEWATQAADDIHFRIQKVNGVGSASFLPKFVMDWAGENARAGYGDFNVTLSDDDNYETHLASLNDQGRPFSEIASIIREQL